jgi:hypothetical protein
MKYSSRRNVTSIMLARLSVMREEFRRLRVMRVRGKRRKK